MYIYGLIDPTNGMISYIGKSVDPWKRYGEHLHADGNTRKDLWIRRLRNYGVMPMLVVLQQVDDGRADAVEMYWMTTGVQFNWPLMNDSIVGKVMDIVLAERDYLPIDEEIVRAAMEYGVPLPSLCDAVSQRLMNDDNEDIPLAETIQ